MNELVGKVAIVTGATSGIGAAIAERYVAEGARVVLAARRADAGAEAVARLGPAAEFVRTDVTVEAEVERLVEHTVSRYGRLDVLVNNAGVLGAGGGVLDLELGDFDATVAMHVRSVLAGMKHAGRVMAALGGGSIINVTSIAGRFAGWAGLSYSTAKAATIAATRGAATELAPHGVRVNSLSPGPILTGIFGKGAGMDPAHADRTAADLEPTFLQRLHDWQPLRRAGLPVDLAGPAVWLGSDASAFVTGQDVVVDGGITAGRPPHVAAAERSAMAAAFGAGAR
jgi:NAD(P)-dependent dehydrogenase (short-subunit alcohol dehydrogenase family)